MLSSLAKKWSPNSLNWSFSWFFPPPSLICAHVCFLCVLAIFWRLCFRHYKMAQDTSEDYFFWMLWRWEEHQRVTYFPSQPCTAIPRRGTHTKDWWDRGRDGGGGERAGSDELQPKRKTHSFSSAAREGGNSQLCRHNMTMNVRAGCEVPSCCDW